MQALITYLKNFQALNQNEMLSKVYAKKRLQKSILDYNRIDQLYNHGIDSTGNVLQSYAANTIAIKRRKGQPTDRTTLKDTGEFYSTFELKVYDNNDIEVKANDGKKELFSRYGNDITGWTPENTEEIKEEVKDLFINEVQRIIFKGL